MGIPICLTLTLSTRNLTYPMWGTNAKKLVMIFVLKQAKNFIRNDSVI